MIVSRTVLLAACLCVLGAGAQAVEKIVGGPIKKIYAVVAEDDDNMTTTSGALKPLKDASLDFNITKNGTPVIVTFTAECYLFNSTTAANWVIVEIHDNGKPLLPTGGEKTPLAFCTGSDTLSAAVQAAAKLDAGPHTISVEWSIHKDSNDKDLIAGLDDWSLTVLQAK